MSSSSDDDVNEDISFYRQKPEWKDVQPLPLDDGDDSVVVIDYSPQFRDVYDYFRAIVQKDEKSERALQLTQDAVVMNPANYTVWQYRREILKALNKDLHDELEFLQHIILSQSKNYQVWQHRRILVEWLNDASKEKYLTEIVLGKDAKNYHAWQHRQWVIKAFDLYEGELEFAEQLISDDMRNNSAWNHRYFIINNTSGFNEEVIDREVHYTIASISTVSGNESSWNYLRGVLLQSHGGLSDNNRITEFCEELYKSGNRSPFLLGVIIDMCSEQITKGNVDSAFNIQRAKSLCTDLCSKYDVIRSKYWEYISDNLEKAY